MAKKKRRSRKDDIVTIDVSREELLKHGGAMDFYLANGSYRDNPLRRGWSREMISDNIYFLMEEGFPQKQAVAIALRTARKNYRARHPRGSFPSHLQDTRK